MAAATLPRDDRTTSEILKAWVQLSRPPFHLVGVFPFALGALLAWRLDGVFSWPVFIWSTLAVVLIMLSTYYAGEYYDLDGDRLSGQMERNVFSGGTQAIVNNLLPPSHAKNASYLSMLLAVGIGLLLQFHFHTGPWTIPLGLIGMIAGFFYSTPPRWVKRGIGEFLIGVCYGWLPVATAFYLQTGRMDHLVHWISIPIACTIFNVILINEFPDYPADLIDGKRNLVVRLGKRSAASLYMAVTAAAWLAFGAGLTRGVPAVGCLFYLPFFLIGVMLVVWMSRKAYLDRTRLEQICGLTIVVNLGTSLSYILAVWMGGA